MAPPVLYEVRGLSPTGNLRIDTAIPPSPLSLNASEVQLSKDDRHETKLQEHWDKSIAKHMDLPDGYHNVHVLIIKWADEIDQLGVRQEVEDLTSVFENVFKYDVTKVELGTSKTQLQLEAAISTWAYEHDGRENLLIVYYAGHAIYDRSSKVLEFSPTNEINGPRVIWNRAEKPFLETVEADVFALMDCCYASDLLRNVPEYGRTFEMLAASHVGATTSQPGEDSFTRCLIKHLQELAKESSRTFFTTRDIQERMQKERGDQGPALWRRIPGSSRNIRLSKLNPLDNRPKRNKELLSHERFLHLGFALKNETLSEKHIENLTKKLPKLFNKEGVPLVDIKWLGCRKVGGPTFKDVATFVVKNRGNLSAISPVSERKRAAEGEGLEEGSGEVSRQRKVLRLNLKETV